MKIGLIREGKVPHDKRVAFSPAQCAEIKAKYPSIEVYVQPSPHRCFTEAEYAANGAVIQEDMSQCDLLMGIKEVPVGELIANKTYMFFSHTMKKQPYNRKLLVAALEKNIRIIDYEVLTNDSGERVLAFGRFAGIVGAYNGIRGYGLKTKRFNLKPAFQCFDMHEMQGEYAKISLPAIKIGVTGSGRVAKGALEVLDAMKIKKVSAQDLVNNTYNEPVYAILRSSDYHEHEKGGEFDSPLFYKDPSQFRANFKPFGQSIDVLIACAYWNPKAPKMFTTADMKDKNFKIKFIADVTCDIDGSIPSTKRASNILDPYYDYNPQTEQLEPHFSKEDNITVMAVDNLPTELPRDASESFGYQFIQSVLPQYFVSEHAPMIARATITENKKLTPHFAYLQDYADGK